MWVPDGDGESQRMNDAAEMRGSSMDEKKLEGWMDE